VGGKGRKLWISRCAVTEVVSTSSGGGGGGPRGSARWSCHRTSTFLL